MGSPPMKMEASLVDPLSLSCLTSSKDRTWSLGCNEAETMTPGFSFPKDRMGH